MRVLPINDKVGDYTNNLLSVMKAAGVRATVDEHADKLGAKIRRAELDKVTYALIVGDKEAEANEVSVRSRFTGEEGTTTFDTFLTRVREEINTRKLMLRQK